MARQPIPNPTPKKKAPASSYPSKAYAPVPAGYKGNWNVPKGTPWKKDSPFNPANANKGPTSKAPSPRSVAAAKSTASQNSRPSSNAPSPASVSAAKKAAASRSAASYKASDSKMMTMAKQGTAAVAAKKKAVASYPTPADRAGSRMNVKRAAQTNRANQASAAASSAASTKKSVSTGTKNKLKKMK